MVGITGAPGLFPGSPAPQNVLFVQLFLAVMSVPILFAAILIEERGAVEMRLRESQEKLGENYHRARELAVKLINAQEDERKRIALELHDDIGQRLSLLSVALDEWEVRLPSRLSFEHAQLSGLRRSAKELVAAVHDLSHRCIPNFQHLGLVGGLLAERRSIAAASHCGGFQHHEIQNFLRYQLVLIPGCTRSVEQRGETRASETDSRSVGSE